MAALVRNSFGDVRLVGMSGDCRVANRFGDVELDRRFKHLLRPRIAKQRQRPMVDHANGAFQVAEDDAVGGGLHQRAIVFLASLQVFLEPQILGHFRFELCDGRFHFRRALLYAPFQVGIQP